MKFRFILSYFLFASLLFSSNSLKLVLNSGEILIGKSESLIKDAIYLINSDILGEISIPKNKVRSFTVLKGIETEALEKAELTKESPNQLSSQTQILKKPQILN